MTRRGFGNVLLAATLLCLAGCATTVAGPPGPPGVAGQTAITNAVERPLSAGRYEIVAAGLVRGDGNARQPVYNALRAKAERDGEVLLTFAGYALPQGSSFQYVVKVVGLGTAARTVLVTVDRFEQRGMVLRVTNSSKGSPVQKEILLKTEFSVEISRFE
ncbi:MAG: hypothetical protein U0231_02595 [Nitrospiraceae bacterium]